MIFPIHFSLRTGILFSALLLPLSLYAADYGQSAAAAMKPGHNASTAVPTYRIVDLMPSFWNYWEKAKHLNEQAQARLFMDMVVSRHAEAYAPHVIGFDAGKPFDQELMKRWQQVMPLVSGKMDQVRRISGSIERDLPKYEARFREAFPDLAYRGDIYFMFSLGAFDGAVRTIGGKPALLFGMDMIAHIYGSDIDPAPFFHHELFHVYHAQFKEASPVAAASPMIAALWGEGLATYVAHALNPSAGGVSVFGLPRSTPERVRADLPALAGALRGLLDSTSAEDYRRFFLGSREDAATPARSGYYIGYLVAAELAKTHSLQQLAHLPLSRLRPDIEAALRKLETGATGAPERPSPASGRSADPAVTHGFLS